MKLLAAFLSIVEDWQDVFPQQRTYQRAVRQALGSLICLGRRCLSRIIWTNGGQHRSSERGVLSPLPLPMGTAAVIPTDSQARFGLLSTTAGRRGP